MLFKHDSYTRESRGFAFVRFYDKRDAEDAMDALDGTRMDGRELRVNEAKYSRPARRNDYGRNRPSPRRYNRRRLAALYCYNLS